MSFFSKQNHLWKSIWTPIAAGAFMIVLMLAVHAMIQNRPESQPGESRLEDFPRIEAIRTVIADVAAQYNLSGCVSHSVRNGIEEWSIALPGNVPAVSVHQTLKASLKGLNTAIIRGMSDPSTGSVRLSVGFEDSCFLTIYLNHSEESRQAGRIALIIDDFGDRWDEPRRAFFDLGADITATVIPGFRRSKEVASFINELGFEVLIHLPMEPESKVGRGYKYMVTTKLTAKEIARIVQQAIDEIPGAAGMNNHMGSKATAHTETMQSVLSAIKGKGLFFIDSRTGAGSVAWQLARSNGIRCSRRDVFLDVIADREAIRKSLWQLAGIASKRGSAVGIGHASRLTLQVLQEEIPKLQAKGYEFVRVSRIVT